MIALGLGIAFLLVSSANGFYGPGDDVIELKPYNFHKSILNSTELWIVEFYAPWCGPCQSLTPEWKKAASALRGVVKVGAIDVNEYQHLVYQYGVKKLPTIKIFGADKFKPSDYQGALTAQSIVDSALSAVKSMGRS